MTGRANWSPVPSLPFQCCFSTKSTGRRASDQLVATRPTGRPFRPRPTGRISISPAVPTGPTGRHLGTVSEACPPFPPRSWSSHPQNLSQLVAFWRPPAQKENFFFARPRAAPAAVRGRPVFLGGEVGAPSVSRGSFDPSVRSSHLDQLVAIWGKEKRLVAGPSPLFTTFSLLLSRTLALPLASTPLTK